MAYPYEEEDRRAALTQGLLAAGLAALGARKGSEYNAFAQAGLLGLGGYNRSLEGATEARDRKAQREMQQAQFAHQQAQWAQAQRQMAELEAAKRAATLPGMPGMPAQEADNPGGTYMPPTPPTPGGFDRQKYGQLLETIDPVRGAAYLRDIAKPTKEIFKQEVVTDPQTNQRILLKTFKDGTQEASTYLPDKEKPVSGSTGGRVNIPLDPWTLKPMGEGLQATPSPDALLSDRRLREQNDIARGNAAGSAADSLRKEFNALPPVQAFGKVLPALQSAREAVGQDNAAADLNLIYAAAKVFDPESVVRESETTMVASAGSPAQRFIGQFNYVAGGGRLTPETRKQLMQQIESRARGYETSYNAARKTYSTLAAKRGVDAADVFIEPTTSSVGGPEYKDPRASGGAIKPAAASMTLPDPKSLPDGSIVTDTQTGRKLKVRNGRYVSP